MSMVTVSTKRDRVYQRAFDHEAAQRLRAAGWTYPRLAEHFGVSETAVMRVCDPKQRERLDGNANRWIYNQRKPCEGGCGKLVFAHQETRTGYCARCLAERRGLENVREDTLRCTKCGEWKPDDDFYKATKGSYARRGRKHMCRACEAKARREFRNRSPERQEHERALANNYKRKARKMAKFAVLVKTDSGLWREVNDGIEAVSRLHAIEKVANAEGDYIAISASQLRPKAVRSTQAFKVVKGDDAE